jgi:hypothetical protein
MWGVAKVKAFENMAVNPPDVTVNGNLAPLPRGKRNWKRVKLTVSRIKTEGETAYEPSRTVRGGIRFSPTT